MPTDDPIDVPTELRIGFIVWRPMRCRSRRFADPVADTAHRHHDRGTLGVLLDLGPQALNVNIDQTGVGRVLVAPHLAEELLAGEDLPRRAGQGHQQLELERRQGDDRLTALDLVTGDIDVEVPGTHVLGRPGLVRRRRVETRASSSLDLKGLVT